MKILVLFLIFISIQACTNAEKKKPLHYLNGENYFVPERGQGANSLVPIPVGKDRMTRLKGSVVLTEGVSRIPLKMQQVYLKKDDKVIAETVTNTDGTYYFTGIYTNGFYEIESESKTYKGSIKFQISDYKYDNLVIIAKSK